MTVSVTHRFISPVADAGNPEELGPNEWNDDHVIEGLQEALDLKANAADVSNVDNTSDADKPVSTAQQAALDLKANIASPTFTGTVSGITKAMVGLGSVDNTSDADKPVSTAQQTALNAKVDLAGGTMTGALVLSGDPTSALHAAPKQYVDAQVAAIVDSAPATLDTLNELAAALGDDANFAATTATAIGLKAPIASPTFTGTPAAPTAAADTSTTQIATTAFVVGQAATATPLMDGTAAVGTSLKYAREDHKHPGSVNFSVADRTALAGTASSADAVYLRETGREGVFVWDSSDLSAKVTLDTQQGIYVAPTSDTTGASGVWARVVTGAVSPEWFGAVGDGTTDDSTAINAAIAVAGVGGIVDFGSKIYACASTITQSLDGVTLRGRQSAGSFETTPGVTEGTILKWTGSSGGTLCYFGCLAGGSADLCGGGIHGIQFDGNALADRVLHIRSTSFSTYSHLKIYNPRDNAAAHCLHLDSDVETRDGVNAVFRCSFRDFAVSSGAMAAKPVFISGASDEATLARHTTFCTFDSFHITHKDGDGVTFDAADSCIVSNIGFSKVSGGTGLSINLKPRAGLPVVGLTFLNLGLGSNDTPTFNADASAASSFVHNIAIYGLQGVDTAPTITLSGGATIERVDYLGHFNSSDAATRGAYSWSPPIKLGNYESSDSETLDFYKERVNSPTLSFNGASTGMSASFFSRTTRVGNMVQCKVQGTVTTKGTSTGPAVISGLPYSAVDGWVLHGWFSGMASGVTEVVGLTSGSAIGLYKVSSGSMVDLTDADFVDGATLVISGIYQTADSTP